MARIVLCFVRQRNGGRHKHGRHCSAHFAHQCTLQSINHCRRGQQRSLASTVVCRARSPPARHAVRSRDAP
eukprot:6115423-Pleurochrysis_carterae.AAC.1